MATAKVPNHAQLVGLGEKLYSACFPIQAEEPQHIFGQDELLLVLEDHSLGDPLQTLLLVTQTLVDQKLLKVVRNPEGQVGWMLRTQEEAVKYRSLTTEQELVYSYVDESGHEGIWSKLIKARTNLHEAVFSNCIKLLVSRNFICEVKSVEHPTRKMYIRAALRPSERVTGGPWFSDGELDDEFITMALMILLRHIQKRSWARHKTRAASQKQPKTVIRGVRSDEAAPRGEEKIEYLPMPAGYDKYMTLDELTLKVEESAVFNQILTAMEVQQLLDVLIYDNKIERVMCGTRWGYRALKHTFSSEENVNRSPMSEIPCGRCPVFELCEEGGPVTPTECVYLDEWLTL